MVFLIDTNVIIRFLTGDNEEFFEKSINIFRDLERGKIEVELLPSILAEVYFVMIKVYRVNRVELIKDLKKIVTLKGVKTDRGLLIETLNILEKRNIDFVDALICAKSKIGNYKILSFDEDLKRC
jgi:predicted nucleic acid-binding protein